MNQLVRTRGRDDVPATFVGRRRKQPRIGGGLSHGAGVGDAAQLNVARAVSSRFPSRAGWPRGPGFQAGRR